MSEGYVFKISGDIANYAKELGKVPGVTDKAAAAAALKMGQQFAKMQADATKKSQAAAKSAGDAWTQTAGLLKNSAKVSGFGELSEKAGAAGAAIEAMLSPAGALAAGFGAVGLAAGGAVAGVFTLGLALTKSAFAAEANLKALEGFRRIGSDFYPAIPVATLESFRSLAATEDALISIGDRLSIVAASSVAPSLERVADVAVGLALQGERLFEVWAGGRNLFEELATGVLAGFAQALTLPMAPLVALGDGVGLLAKISGVDLPAGIQAAIKDLDRLRDGQWSRSMAESAIAAAENSDAFRALGAATSEAERLGRSFIDTQQRATAAEKDAAKATKEHEAAIRAMSAAMMAENQAAQQSQAAYQGALDALAQITETQKAAIRSGLEQVEADHQATLARIQDDRQRALSATTTLAGIETAEQAARDASLAANAAYAQQLQALDQKRTEDARSEAEQRSNIEQQSNQAKFQLAASAASALLSLTETVGQNMTEEQKRASMALFVAQKIGALAQAGINTALAASNALATPAPPPIPEVLAAAAVVAGGAAAIQIASAPPPKFHTGTMYASPSGALRADEFAATLQRGEIVIDRQTASKPGVREAVASMSTGAPMGSAGPDDVAEGMDRSSLPGLLSELISEVRRLGRQPSPHSGRPGHRPSYGY